MNYKKKKKKKHVIGHGDSESNSSVYTTSRILQNDTSSLMFSSFTLSNQIRRISRFPLFSDNYAYYRSRATEKFKLKHAKAIWKGVVIVRVPALHSWVAGVSPWGRGRGGRRCGGWWRRPWGRAERRRPRPRHGWCSGTRRRRGPEAEWNHALHSAGTAALSAASSTPPCQFGSRKYRSRETIPRATTEPQSCSCHPWSTAKPSSLSVSLLSDDEILFFSETNPPVGLCKKCKIGKRNEESASFFILFLL